TKEGTEKMAEFFREKDAAGAKAYFETILKQRPDILMEASDINGECKLCLQAVSTANLELAEYGHCFLEWQSDYAAVINYFRRLNSLASDAVRSVSAESQMGKAEYVRTIEEKSCKEAKGDIPPWTTDIALRAAIRLYATSQEIAKRAYSTFHAYASASDKQTTQM
nr:capsular biosynthesis protein [Lachnospiraceae bacterium]